MSDEGVIVLIYVNILQVEKKACVQTGLHPVKASTGLPPRLLRNV